jgi:hypothetical protein
MFDANTALLIYHAAQDTTCRGIAVQIPVWATSLYIRRGDRWFNVFYQQTQLGNEERLTLGRSFAQRASVVLPQYRRKSAI